MKFLRYKPVKWGVKVGQSYSPNYEGIRFFYDIDSRDGELSNSADNISDLAYILRRELIKPDQIENIGTINPIKTSEIKDRLFENLIKRVSRPMIIVYDLPLERVHKTKINEYGLDSNKKIAIELGGMMQITQLDKAIENPSPNKLANPNIRTIPELNEAPEAPATTANVVIIPSIAP